MWYNILGKCPILLATVMKGVAESVAELKVTKFPALESESLLCTFVR